MSLWTPGGERTPAPTPDDAPSMGSPAPEPDVSDLSPEEQARFAQMQDEMRQVQEQLLAAPAAVVVANHAMGLYELAAIHLTAPQPKLAEASLAIDALAAVVTGLQGRLDEAESTLVEGLAQLRSAYLELRSAPRAAASP